MVAKARTAAECGELSQLPNVGPAMVQDLHILGIHRPEELKGRDGWTLYAQLCAATGARHDPCVLDTMLAVVDFMQGAPAAPWWHYTAARKQRYGASPDPFAVPAPASVRDGTPATSR